MALDGLEARSNNAADDESATMIPACNFKVGTMIRQMGTIRALVVEFVITFAISTARNEMRYQKRQHEELPQKSGALP